MKVLVDTSVWSLALIRSSGAVLSVKEERAKATLRELIEDGRVALVGPIRQELLSGVRDEAQFERLRERLAIFEDEALTAADYEEAARMDNLCRARGGICGPVDILLCAVAHRRRWTLWTHDQGLMRCMASLRGTGVSL